MNTTDLLFAMEVKKETDKMVQTLLSKNAVTSGRKFNNSEMKQVRNEFTKQVLVDVFDTLDTIENLTK